MIGEENWRAMCYEEVLPRDIRMVGDLFADRLARGERPHTSLECWFRRVVRGVARRGRGEEYEPWVILTAMAYSMTDLGDPAVFATYAPMPCSAIEFRNLVHLSVRERPKSTDRNPV